MKIINKLKLSFLGGVTFLAALSSSSCSEFSLGGGFIDQMPESVGVNADTMFSKKYYANQVLSKSYQQLHYPINWSQQGYDRMGGDLSDALTDLSHSTMAYGGSNQYYVGSLSASSVTSKANYNFTNWKTWSGIRYAWLMIENVDKVPDMTQSEKDRAKAEAKVLIATHYADMFRHFGGVPILRKAISTDDEFDFPRASAQKTLDFIIELLDSAIPHLEWKVADPNDDGRMTAGYARGLKLRVLLFAASPLFNNDTPYMSGSDEMTWLGEYDASRWAAAAKAGAEFFSANNGAYTLNSSTDASVEGYRKAFRDAYFTRGNSEMLLSIRRGYKNSYTNSFCGGSDNFANAQSPTLKYFEMFPMADGSEFDFNWSDPASSANVNPYDDRDPRFYETILAPNVSYKGHKSELWVGGVDRPTANGSTGFKMYKFSQDYTSATSIGQVDCYPAMRLAEVMLSYAEALNESDGSKNIAAQMIWDVRNRVGLTMPSVAELEAMNKEDMRDFILDERARELGYEDVRWFDIVRWKMESSFTTPIEGVNMRRSGGAVVPDATYSYEIYGDISVSRVWASDWDSKWYLAPFPSKEVQKNYGLVQNPGW